MPTLPSAWHSLVMSDFQLFCSLEFKMGGSRTPRTGLAWVVAFVLYSMLFVAGSARGLRNGGSRQQQLECGGVMRHNGSFFCDATKLLNDSCFTLAKLPIRDARESS